MFYCCPRKTREFHGSQQLPSASFQPQPLCNWVYKKKKKKKIRWKSFSTTLTQGRLVVHPEIQRVLGEPGRQILASTEHQALAPAKGLQTMKLSREPGGSDTCTCSQIPLSMPGLGPISYTYKMCFTGPPLMRLCCVLEEALFFSFFLFSI